MPGVTTMLRCFQTQEGSAHQVNCGLAEQDSQALLGILQKMPEWGQDGTFAHTPSPRQCLRQHWDALHLTTLRSSIHLET